MAKKIPRTPVARQRRRRTDDRRVLVTLKDPDEIAKQFFPRELELPLGVFLPGFSRSKRNGDPVRLSLDGPRIKAAMEGAVGVLRNEPPERAEMYVAKLAMHYEISRQMHELLGGWSAARVINAAKTRAAAPHPLSEQIKHLIKQRGLSDRGIAEHFRELGFIKIGDQGVLFDARNLDRGAVSRERKRLGYTVAQVRAIRDGL